MIACTTVATMATMTGPAVASLTYTITGSGTYQSRSNQGPFTQTVDFNNLEFTLPDASGRLLNVRGTLTASPRRIRFDFIAGTWDGGTGVTLTGFQSPVFLAGDTTLSLNFNQDLNFGGAQLIDATLATTCLRYRDNGNANCLSPASSVLENLSTNVTDVPSPLSCLAILPLAGLRRYRRRLASLSRLH
jgi:hypothetical protein